MAPGGYPPPVTSATRAGPVGADVGGTPPAPVAFDLLESKLTVPPPRPGLVPRDRLVARIGASSARIVSIGAPAGYGKTALLRELADVETAKGHVGRRVAWVSLDAADNDPIVLLTYIATAVDRVEPIGRGVFEALASTGVSVRSVVTPRLGAAVAALSYPIVVILDDLHLIADPACTDAIAQLAGHLRVGSRLVFASRGVPALRLARLRAAGDLLEIGPTDLALDEESAIAMVRATDPGVSRSQAIELHRVTEGWPAGLYLASLSLGAAGQDPVGTVAPASGAIPPPTTPVDGRSSIAGFGGDDRFVADYLRSELLAPLPDDVREFLIRTSVLDRLSGPSCDAVLQATGSAERLEWLERSNLLVVPLDHRREWYRYHTLLREALGGELVRHDPKLARALHRRASAWFAAEGQPETAIEHARSADDVELIADLVAQAAVPFYYSGRSETVERWFSWFEEPTELEAHPTVAILGALLHALTGRSRDAERWIEAARHARLEDVRPPDGSHSLVPWMALARALMAPEGLVRFGLDAGLAVSGMHPASPFQAAARFVHGVHALLSGAPDEAERELSDGAEIARSLGSTDSEVAILGELSAIAAARGDWATVETLVLRGRQTIIATHLDHYVSSGLVMALRARAEARRGHREEALACLGRVSSLRPRLTDALPWFSVQVRLETARAYLALGDAAGARTVIGESRFILRRHPDLGTLTGEFGELATQVDRFAASASGVSSLSGAELRLLTYLPMHLTFREIAARLYVSPNTVKSQALSLYGKLGVSSRSEAVQRAAESGLLDASLASLPHDFTSSG